MLVSLLFAHGYVNFGDYLSILGPQLFFSRFPRVVTRKERVENIIYLCGICLPRIPPQKSAPKKRKSALYTTLKKSAPKPKIVFFSAFSAFSAKAYRGSAYIRHSPKKQNYVRTGILGESRNRVGKKSRKKRYGHKRVLPERKTTCRNFCLAILIEWILGGISCSRTALF